MATCPSCGKENSDGFQFCGFCSAPLTEQPRSSTQEERKVITSFSVTSSASQLRPKLCGLYFLGLSWQHTRGSALLGWVKDDAEFIANKIDAEAPAGVAPEGGWHADATDAPQVASAKERSDS